MTAVQVESIRCELDRVLSSSVFSRNERQSKFLRFVVERRLEGRDRELKESVIAVEAFGRDPGYDPKLDGIVRTEALRLRVRLEKYYAGDGREDPLIIELPKGGYRPVFRERETVAAEQLKVLGVRRRWMAATIAGLAVGVGLLVANKFGGVPSDAAAGVWGSQTPVIAVLPFKNLSSEPDSDSFVDGLTEEIIRNLAVIDGLQVRSPTSSFYFKNTSRDLASIGEELRANLIVAGSVQRDGKRLRINAQLVSVAADVPLWSDRYDTTLEEVFAVQDEISRGIVNKLRLTLGRGQRRYQLPVDAYELYLRGRALAGRRGTENARQAARLFEEVIEKDPAFAPAYAGLADAYTNMSWSIEGLSEDEGLRRMRPAAIKAIELDPLLAEAHVAMGLTYARELNWEHSQKSFERAIELNPSLTQIHTKYAVLTLLPLGKVRRAQQLLEAALITDPVSLELRVELAMAQITAGRYDDAIANLRHVLASDPKFAGAPRELGRALMFGGRPAEAITVWKTSQGDWERWLAPAYVMLGRRAELERLVEGHAQEHPYRQALVYGALGDKDRTFEALNRAIDIMPQRTALLLTHPEMALLRGDPRLDALRKRLKLP